MIKPSRHGKDQLRLYLAIWFVSGLCSGALLPRGQGLHAQNIRRFNANNRGNQPASKGEPPNLLRNYQLTTWWKAAQRALETDRPEEALRNLQRIFDSLEDGFGGDDQGKRYTGVKDTAWKQLSQAKGELRQLYEQVYGGEARGTLTQPTETDQLRNWREVHQRWFHTRAGGDATYQLALWHRDHGEPEMGARYARRLLNDPWHSASLSRSRQGALAMVIWESGDSKLAESVLKGDSGPFTFGETTRPGTEWLHARPTFNASHRMQDWNQPLGNSMRNGMREGTPPMSSAVWRRPLLTGLREDSTRQIERHWQQIRDRNESIGNGHSAVIVGDQLIFRDSEWVRSVRLTTGEELWRYRTEYRLGRVLEALRDEEGRPARDQEFDQLFLQNSLLGSLSTDGERVYFVDGMTEDPANRRGGLIGDESRFGPSYRLVALSVSPDREPGETGALTPVWTCGGNSVPTEGTESEESAGHCFLGPPTPAHGSLYAISEHRGTQSFVELDPRTGEILRVTPYAVQQVPITQDLSRANWVCMPSIAGGVAVCPSQRGALVGIDVASHSLLWMATGQFSGRESRSIYQSIKGHEGFFALPVVRDQLVFDLQRTSDRMQALNLQTGETLWSLSRGDAEYIGGVLEGVLIVVGQQGCRGLEATTGKELWQTRLGNPCGRGIGIKGAFLIPLAGGQIVSVDAKTGTQQGYAPPLDHRRSPGHLLFSQGMVVSLSAIDLAVYPQAGKVLDELLSHSNGMRQTSEDLLTLGSLRLRLGDLPAAQSSLRQAIELAENSSGQKEQAEHLMRELLYLRLRHPEVEGDAILAELRSVSRKPEDRVKYLAYESEFAFAKGELQRSLQVGMELATLPIETTVSMPGEPDLQVVNRYWAAGHLERVFRDRKGDAAFDATAAFREELERCRNRGELADWDRLLAWNERRPEGAVVREEMAKLCLSRGELQRAELLLLKNRECGDLPHEAEATWLLAQLWNRTGFSQEAGEALYALRTKYRDVRLSGGRTGEATAQVFPQDELASRYARCFLPLTHAIDRVRIELQLGEGSPLGFGVGTHGRPTLTSEYRGSYVLLDRAGLRGLSMVDLTTGQSILELNLPESFQSCWGRTGHLFPVAGPTSGFGVSMVERKVLWDQLNWQGREQRGHLWAGPSGSEFAIYQTRQQELFVADPCTGKIRWRRNDLEPNEGLFQNQITGVIADERATVVFGRDGIDYRVYDTLCGRELQRGRLECSGQSIRYPFGAKLVYTSLDEGKTMVSLWDGVRNEIVFRCEVQNNLFCVDEYSREFAVVDPQGVLHVIHGPSGVERFHSDLSEAIVRGNQLRVFSDGERYYVNLPRSINRSLEKRSYLTAVDMMLPKINITGELYAFSKRSGRLLWKRVMPTQSLVHLPQYPLPFLIGVSRVRSLASSTSSGGSFRMRVEVLDGQTGNTLGLQNDLPNELVRHMDYDRDAETIVLLGTENAWKLQFGTREVPRVPVGDPLAAAQR